MYKIPGVERLHVIGAFTNADETDRHAQLVGPGLLMLLRLRRIERSHGRGRRDPCPYQ